MIAHRYIREMFECSEPDNVLWVLNGFLFEFATWGSARQVPSQLCPSHIQSPHSLENWLIPVRIEAQRQTFQSVLGRSGVLLLKEVLEAASRRIQILMHT